MDRPISFRGHSGRTYVFSVVDARSDWVRKSGIALFAAPNGCTWRVIRLVSLRGREDDVQPIWALHDAVRYGGDTVLVLEEANPAARSEILADLDAGLSPLWPTPIPAQNAPQPLQLAA